MTTELNSPSTFTPPSVTPLDWPGTKPTAVAMPTVDVNLGTVTPAALDTTQITPFGTRPTLADRTGITEFVDSNGTLTLPVTVSTTQFDDIPGNLSTFVDSSKTATPYINPNTNGLSSTFTGTEGNNVVTDFAGLTGSGVTPAQVNNWANIFGSGKPADNADKTSLNTSANTLAVGSAPASTVVKTVSDFNARNNRLNTAVSNPTSVYLYHDINKDGSADITVSWSWGSSSETDDTIDGFLIYFKYSRTNPGSTVYTLTDSDSAVPVTPGIRKITVTGNAADIWYTIGVRAFRKVDPDILFGGINANGIIRSSIVQVNNYQPAAYVDFTGRVAGTDAASLIAAHNSTVAAVGDIADDGKLTPSEKQSLLKQWIPTKAEYASVLAQANDSRYASAVATQRSAFQTSYTTLLNFLEGTGGPLSSALLGSTSSVTPSTIESYISDYVDKRQALLNAMQNTTTDTASNVVAAIYQMAADKYIDANEKKAIKQEWLNISTEKAGIDAQATAQGITTEKTTYDNAFQALANFLNNGTTWTSGLPYYINDARKEINEFIDTAGRDSFASVAQAFYNAKEALNNKLHAAASETALWSKTASKPSNIFTSGLASNINGAFAFRESWTYNAQSYPDKWSAWTNWTTDVPIKDTTLVRAGENSIGWDNIASIVNVGIAQNIGCTIDKNTTISGSIDVYIKSLTGSNLPTLYFSYFTTASAFIGQVWFQPKNIVGSWQTLNFSIPGNGVNDIGILQVIAMGSWSATGQVNGSVRFANLQLRTQDGAVFDNRKQQAADIQGQLNASTQLLDASLTAAKTAIAAIDPSSGNLTANSVTTANLVAGAVTALKIAVGQLDAISANIGTITAGTIDTSGYVRARGAVSAAGYNCAVVANDSNTQQVGVLSYGTVIGELITGGSYGVLASSSAGTGVYGGSTSGIGVNGTGAKGVYGYSTTGGYAVHADGILHCTTLQVDSAATVTNLSAASVQGYTPGSFALSGHTHSYVGSVYCTYNEYSATPSSNQIQMHSAIGGYGFNGRSTNVIELLSFSDERLKNSIADETLGLEFIRQVKYKTYKLNSDSTYKWHGVIAQDIKEIAPEGVDSLFQIHDDGMYGVDYNSLHSVAGKALQELDAIVTQQSIIIANLLSRIEALENQ